MGLKSGPKIHFDQLEGVDEVEWTKARKINLCTFLKLKAEPIKPLPGSTPTRVLMERLNSTGGSGTLGGTKHCLVQF